MQVEIWDIGADGCVVGFGRFGRLFPAALGVLRLAGIVDPGHGLVILQIDVVFDSFIVHWHGIVGKEALIALFYYGLLTDCFVVERSCSLSFLELLHGASWLSPVRI